MNILNKETLFFPLFTFHFLFSVSAPPFPFEVQQPNGSKIPVRMFGHEYYNWMETEDGYVIEFVDESISQGWYYSKLDESGKFIASENIVTYPAPVTIDIPKHLREISPKVRDFTYGFSNTGVVQNKHLYRGIVDSTLTPLVLLVDFRDENHEYTADQFNHLLFTRELKYLSPDNTNLPLDYEMSVRDYYYEISNGKQSINGDLESIFGWTRADNNYSYYVDGVQGTGEGTNGVSRSAAALVVEIAMELDAGVDFRKFDNGDGAIDVVILIVAGQGGQSDNHFWPHMYVVPTDSSLADIAPPEYINNGHFSLDGVVIRKYIVIQEKFAWNHSGAEINMIHPIGTICHELGHVLGIPDFYDTSDNSAAGIGEWGLMGSGNWQSQISPAYMNAWSRYRLEYIHPVILENVIDSSISFLSAEKTDSAAAYILPMDSNIPQEYLILENRQKQQSGADQDLLESGLLVWHIDETITDMYPALNAVNVNPNLYGVNLLQADGLGELYTNCNTCADAGDIFPFGPSSILTGSTNPNTDTYSYDRDVDGEIELGGNSDIEIKDIQNSGGIISLTLSNPNIQGHILGYDEGNFEGIAFPKVDNQLEWAGIRITAPDTALLAGIETVFPPSTSLLSEVTDYTINIWQGWTENQPEQLLYTYPEPGSADGNVQWSFDEFRDGGWAYISLADENIFWNGGDEYYVEINFNGTGAMYFFDQGIYSQNTADGKSYYRGGTQDDCKPLHNVTDAQNGDWNIRAVLSGQNCGVIENWELWPGDTNGNFVVDAEDIVPIGIYYGYHGCYRQGAEYVWEAQPYPDGWEVEVAARSDANGDGIVDIADVLVILVNWTGTEAEGNGSSDDVQFTDEELAMYRDNFYEIYWSMLGFSEPVVLIRQKLEELFGFSMLPTDYMLGQNYPNPFNAQTIIPYYAFDVGEVQVVIYDITGRMVDKIVHSHIGEGWYELVYNAENMSSGIYFYRLLADGEIVAINKMLILK